MKNFADIMRNDISPCMNGAVCPFSVVSTPYFLRDLLRVDRRSVGCLTSWPGHFSLNFKIPDGRAPSGSPTDMYRRYVPTDNIDHGFLFLLNNYNSFIMGKLK